MTAHKLAKSQPRSSPWIALALSLTGLTDFAARAEPTRDTGDAIGIASWYGDRHQGRRTASGATFRMEALTAAHRTLPLGSRARITNLANGRTVEVLITDRGPAIAGRIIDVSAQAASVLGMRARGLARVSIEPTAP